MMAHNDNSLYAVEETLKRRVLSCEYRYLGNVSLNPRRVAIPLWGSCGMAAHEVRIPVLPILTVCPWSSFPASALPRLLYL